MDRSRARQGEEEEEEKQLLKTLPFLHSFNRLHKNSAFSRMTPRMKPKLRVPGKAVMKRFTGLASICNTTSKHYFIVQPQLIFWTFCSNSEIHHQRRSPVFCWEPHYKPQNEKPVTAYLGKSHTGCSH